jgi:outer membrane murein-binding lipoprotein Lpp
MPSAAMRLQSTADTSAKAEMDYYYENESPAAGSVAGGAIETASGRAAGDQFEFTLKNPVTLDRRQSAMLPLVEGSIKAEKILIFSGARALGGATINPAISAELVNTSGMKLPAGPITVYEGGTYAGDALIEFFPENEKRLISYGEDLSVGGSVASSGTRFITAANISGGVMTITRRQSYDKVYTIKNVSSQIKKLIIEHPITSGSELVEPKEADDRTASLYRFIMDLPANETITFTVREETPVYERITLAQLRADTFLSYASNQEIPANVREVFAKAIELKKVADDAAAAQSRLETQMTRLTSDQDRIRRNLEAAGNQTPQGQEYLKRMAALDDEIDDLKKQIEAAMQETQRARAEYDSYLATVKI